MSYKSLTKNAVLETAQSLIASERYTDLQGVPYTTTLYVKNELRGNGFWAVQQEVSQYMEELSYNGALDWYDSPHGYYRHYTDSINTLPAQPVQQTPQQPQPTIDDVEETTAPQKGDWVLFMYSDQTQVIYIVGSVPRNTARAYYEKKFSCAYTNVACNRL